MLKKEVHQAELYDILLRNYSSEELLKHLLQRLRQDQNLQLDKLITLFQNAAPEQTVPLSIFASKLHPVEALCKYLKEQEHLSHREIAKLLQRDQRTIWATCQRAEQKMKAPFPKQEEKYLLPMSLFQNRSFSFLESVAFFLHQVYHLSTKQMGLLLHKSQNSMAVLLKRARDKHEA